ncbi:hypothetical protein F2P79_019768 [Pimephales promelas]|nr:hypothetical protein F2P79_019768 [Pimephales promelas]
MDGLMANDTGPGRGTRTANDSGLARGTRTAKDTGLDRGTRMANDTGLAEEKRLANDTGLDYRQRAGHDGRDKFAGRKYLKEATIILNVENVNEVRAADIIKAVVDKCGHGKILALRPRQGKEYELTMENEETCEELMDGLNIKGVNCEIKRLQNRDYVVSFMHLPVYLEDREIIEKLEGWGVDPISKIKRRCYPGTEIEDGTRFLKVRFPKEVASLPYSTRLETAEGQQYFRVMHSHQVKTCRLCMSPDHLLKECPDFKCHKCGERGHFARDCNAARCPECQKILKKCVCMGEEEEGGREHQVDGQVHEGNNEEERQTDVVQEEQVMQQKEMEEGTSNREEEGEQENNKDKEQTMEQDMQWSAMGTSDSGKRYRDEMEKKEIKMDNMENNREPNFGSRFRLRPYHLENARTRLISEAKQGRAWLVLGWETAWEYQVL